MLNFNQLFYALYFWEIPLGPRCTGIYSVLIINNVSIIQLSNFPISAEEVKLIYEAFRTNQSFFLYILKKLN